MRITSTIMHNNIISSLNNSASLINKYNTQLLGGKQVTKPSDDPISMTSILNSRRELNDLDQYEKNISTAKSNLQTAEGALTQISDIVGRVKVLLTQGINGSNNAEERESIALEIDALKDQVGLLANTKMGGYYLFGGADINTPPFNKETQSWQADAKANKRVEIEISKGIFIPINVDGEEVFNGAGLGRNIFDVLSDISQNLRDGDTNELTNRFDDLNGIENQVLKTISGIGATINRIDLMDVKNKDFELNVKEDLANKEEVDIQELYIKLSTAKASYQAGIAVSSKILQVSLVDYLR